MFLNKIHARRVTAGLLLTAGAVAMATEDGTAAFGELWDGVGGLFEASTDAQAGATADQVEAEVAALESEQDWAQAVAPPEAAGEALQVARVYTVSDRTQLRAALTEAQGLAGAEIRLQPGNYGSLRWNYKHYPLGRVILRAATETAPVFTELNVSGSSNMAMVGIRVVSSVSPAVSLGNNMIFAGNFVSGATATTTDPWDDGNSGLHIRSSSRVTVSNNQFENLRSATYVQRSSAVTYEYNTVRYVREGVNVAAATDLDLVGNRFQDFSPKFPQGEHPDAIQFWTSGETMASSKVRIIENAMLFGGCKSIQGIFIGSEVEPLRHSGFEIRRNIYYGSSRNGLAVSSTDNAVVANNVVVASPYGLTSIKRADVTDERCSGALVPGILSRFGGATHSFSRNVTHVIGSTEGTRVDDIPIGSDPGDYKWTDVFLAQPTVDVPDISAFVTRDPSAVRSRGIGVLSSFSAGRTLSGDAALARALSVHKLGGATE
jgi:hypothetical protein